LLFASVPGIFQAHFLIVGIWPGETEITRIARGCVNAIITQLILTGGKRDSINENKERQLFHTDFILKFYTLKQLIHFAFMILVSYPLLFS
jgi:hypothetical protein